jgi:hypothetical protein
MLSVETEPSVYAECAAPRSDFTGFQSRKQREEEASGQDLAGAVHLRRSSVGLTTA